MIVSFVQIQNFANNVIIINFSAVLIIIALINTKFTQMMINAIKFDQEEKTCSESKLREMMQPYQLFLKNTTILRL